MRVGVRVRVRDLEVRRGTLRALLGNEVAQLRSREAVRRRLLHVRELGLRLARVSVRARARVRVRVRVRVKG